MFPPAQHPSLDQIGLYWSDEEVIKLLDEYIPGSLLPSNALVNTCPYKYPSSYLREGIWYLVCAEENESVYEFWRAKGEACKMYVNTRVNGWRRTLEYFQGQGPYLQPTEWLMQEYWLSQKGSCHKQAFDSRLLCRVFLCSGSNSHIIDRNLQNSKTIMESDMINSVASVNLDTGSSGPDCWSKTEVVDTEPGSLSELDCFLRGDYLELNDLRDFELNSPISENSSCCIEVSDECLDSSSTFFEQGMNTLMQGKHSSASYSFTA